MVPQIEPELSNDEHITGSRPELFDLNDFS